MSKLMLEVTRNPISEEPTVVSFSPLKTQRSAFKLKHRMLMEEDSDTLAEAP